MTDNAQFGKVAVLMGGLSAERDVSLKSGNAVLKALLSRGVDAFGIDVGKDILQQLNQAGCDRVFIALHGRGGEDGTLQGALEILGLPYTGSGVMASALAMDKLRTKQIWQACGMPTPAYRVLRSEQDLEGLIDALGLPLIMKPAREGSSIGISKVSRKEQLQSAWQAAAKYDSEVVAEAWITGNEFTAGILGTEVLPLIRLETPNEIYDYDAKYLSNTTKYHCPCGLDDSAEQQIQDVAMQAFRAIGASGWGRVDFMRDENGKSWLIELNTIPGLTDHSLVPMAAKQHGLAFEDLVIRILQQSVHS